MTKGAQLPTAPWSLPWQLIGSRVAAGKLPGHQVNRLLRPKTWHGDPARGTQPKALTSQGYSGIASAKAPLERLERAILPATPRLIGWVNAWRMTVNYADSLPKARGKFPFTQLCHPQPAAAGEE